MSNFPKKPWYSVLCHQVLIAVALGIAIGWLWPDTGVALKPLGDGFIKEEILLVLGTSSTNLIGNSVATVAISRWEGEVTPATDRQPES